jgi:hypothetical protein
MVLDRDDDVGQRVGRKGKAKQAPLGMWEGDGWSGEDELTISMYVLESYRFAKS